LISQKPKAVDFARKKSCSYVGKNEDIALVQFIALFGEMKKGEWLTFGGQHEYWEKAADFIQQTVGTTHKRSSKMEILLLIHFLLYSFFLALQFALKCNCESFSNSFMMQSE